MEDHHIVNYLSLDFTLMVPNLRIVNYHIHPQPSFPSTDNITLNPAEGSDDEEMPDLLEDSESFDDSNLSIDVTVLSLSLADATFEGEVN